MSSDNTSQKNFIVVSCLESISLAFNIEGKKAGGLNIQSVNLHLIPVCSCTC